MTTVDLFTAANDGAPRAQLLNLNEKIRTLGTHIDQHPNDWRAVRALERALKRRRNVFEYVERRE
jgi:ribosomal protein S15P/S13E